MTLENHISELKRLDGIIAKTEEEIIQVKRKLSIALTNAVKASGQKEIDQKAIDALEKHYWTVVKKEGNEYVLVVPKAWDVNFGWRIFEDDAWRHFRVNHLTNWISDIPDFVKKELDFKEPFLVHLEGDYLVGKDVEEIAKRFPQFVRRYGEKLAIKSGSRFDLINALVREGTMPFTNDPVPKELIYKRPLKFELYSYQKKIIDDFLDRSNLGVFIPTGGGKTYIGLAAMSMIKPPYLIVTNKTLIEQWVARIDGLTEIKKDEYDIMTWQGAVKNTKSKKYNLIIRDECFHYDSEIRLADGSKTKIGSIVNCKKQVNVLSYNFEKGIWESKPITNWIRVKPRNPILRIKFTQHLSAITCTSNHEIYVLKRGWVQVKDLKVGEYVISMPKYSDQRTATLKAIGKEQWEVIIGTLLGDGSLSRSKNMARLKLVHGKKQIDYLNYKRRLLSSLFWSKPKWEKTEFSPKTGVFVSASRSSIELTDRNYDEVEMVDKELTIRGLAFWYMDDGSLDSNCSHIHCQGRKMYIVEKFAESLKRKFEVDCKALNTRKGPIISFSRNGTRRFSFLIREFIIPSMQYKLLEKDRGKHSKNIEKVSLKPMEYAVTRVKSIEESKLWGKKPYAKDVYCIDVKDNQNFVCGNVLVHNCHKYPADTYSQLMGVESATSLGLSASPFREDQREDLIVTMTGYPEKIPWVYLKDLGVIKMPECHVWIVKNQSEKFVILDKLMKKELKTFVYSDGLDLGEQIAKRYSIPFVHGQTENRMDVINNNYKLVLSRVGDEGIDDPTIECVVEMDWHGSSKRQSIQRVGRLTHTKSEKEGEHHILMTVEEYVSDKRRFVPLIENGFNVSYHSEISDINEQIQKVEAKQPRPRQLTKRNESKTVSKESEPIVDVTNYPLLKHKGVRKIYDSLGPGDRKTLLFFIDPENADKGFTIKNIMMSLGYTIPTNAYRALKNLRAKKCIVKDGILFRQNFSSMVAS